MVISLIVCTLRPARYGAVADTVRRLDVLAPLPVPPPHREPAAAVMK